MAAGLPGWFSGGIFSIGGSIAQAAHQQGRALSSPDAVIVTKSLSHLPKDVLAIPILKDLLTRDFAFYYRHQNENFLSFSGTVRRIAFEHELNISDYLLTYLFNTPAILALWKGKSGRLDEFILSVERTPLRELLEYLAQIALDDKKLTELEPRATADGEGAPVYRIGLLAGKNQMQLPPALAEAVGHANGLLGQWEFPLANALALLSLSKSGEKVFGLDNRARGLLASLRHEASTIDRALTLALVETLLRIAPLPTKKLVLEGPWAFQRSRVGVPTWHYTGEAGSQAAWSLALPGSPVKIKGLLVYQVHGAEESTLPVRIQRKFYRLVPAAKKGDFSKKSPGKTGEYDSNEVYLDEVVVTPLKGTSYKYGLLEIPLPPGADLLPIPYGMKVGARGSYAKVPETEYQEGDNSYAIPVESLRGVTIFQRLVRFSQAGKFTLPPARFYRTYQPNDKAFEEGRTGANRFVTVR